MFDFEKLIVYNKAKDYNHRISKLLLIKKLDRSTKDQLRRASLSIMLNIAEGAGRFTNKDKRNFYVISRGSVFECVALLDFLQNEEIILKEEYDSLYKNLEELSKMLYGMIKGLS